jgi:trimethylamine--corrinoid protein Co-methyltransferase
MAVVLTYPKKPGMPLIMGGVTTVMDMATTSYSYGAPELSLASAANTDISKWLGLPMFGTGGVTDAKVVDEQAVAEMMTSLFYSLLSGANLVHDVGYIDSGTNASLDALVINQELIGMVRRFGQGINTDAEHLALDLINQIGPGGEYLTCNHTFKHWREWFMPKLQDRADWETWVVEGKQTMLDRTRAETDRILAEYRPPPIDPQLHAELQSLCAAADARHS